MIINFQILKIGELRTKDFTFKLTQKKVYYRLDMKTTKDPKT